MLSAATSISHSPCSCDGHKRRIMPRLSASYVASHLYSWQSICAAYLAHLAVNEIRIVAYMHSNAKLIALLSHRSAFLAICVTMRHSCIWPTFKLPARAKWTSRSGSNDCTPSTNFVIDVANAFVASSARTRKDVSLDHDFQASKLLCVCPFSCL